MKINLLPKEWIITNTMKGETIDQSLTSFGLILPLMFSAFGILSIYFAIEQQDWIYIGLFTIATPLALYLLFIGSKDMIGRLYLLYQIKKYGIEAPLTLTFVRTYEQKNVKREQLKQVYKVEYQATLDGKPYIVGTNIHVHIGHFISPSKSFTRHDLKVKYWAQNPKIAYIIRS
jgi:hypothetical protein